jgi:hypothetical protein
MRSGLRVPPKNDLNPGRAVLTRRTGAIANLANVGWQSYMISRSKHRVVLCRAHLGAKSALAARR